MGFGMSRGVALEDYRRGALDYGFTDDAMRLDGILAALHALADGGASLHSFRIIQYMLIVGMSPTDRRSRVGKLVFGCDRALVADRPEALLHWRRIDCMSCPAREQ